MTPETEKPETSEKVEEKLCSYFLQQGASIGKLHDILNSNILTGGLKKANAVINPDIPADARETAIQKVLRIYSPELMHNNQELRKS